MARLLEEKRWTIEQPLGYSDSTFGWVAQLVEQGNHNP